MTTEATIHAGASPSGSFAGPATDFGLLAAMLKRPQSHIT